MSPHPTFVLTDDGPALNRTSTEQLLYEIRVSFPLKPPRPDDTFEKLMWKGGQQEVVEWVERFLEPPKGRDTF